MPSESSLDLIERAKTGDPQAVDILIARYLPRLQRWASGRLPLWARDLAETQDLIIAKIADVNGTVVGGKPLDIESDELRSWGPFTILERVGAGSYGVVYRAWDSRLDREIALKLLRRRGDEADLAVPTVEEGRLLARVRHPNVVTVHGADRIGGRVGIWMEFVEGQTLEQAVRERGPLDPLDVAHIGIEIARALAAVHRAGLLHRDVKAQNVVRQDDGRIVLMDFGAGHQSGNQDHKAGFAGTPLYIAPELLQGSPASATSDVYSLGVLLYYLVSGEYPVAASNLADMRAAIAARDKRPLANARPDLPLRFVEVIDRAIARDPEARLQTPTALDSALSSYVASADPALVGQRRHRRFATALGIVLALCLGGAAVAGWQRHERPRVAFRAQDWVLVTAFENATGESVFDQSIEYAFQRELTDSAYAHVVSSDRVEEMLRLMRKPAGTKVDMRIGREVCLRDGGIRALLTGRIEKVAGKYVLTSQIVNPVDGVINGSITDEDLTAEQVPDAVRRQALQVRSKLGETRDALESSRLKLEKVTTPSFRALRLYSSAYPMVLGAERSPSTTAAAEPLVREALAIDPSFASAEIMLAWVIHNHRPKPASEEYLGHVQRALDLAVSTSELEQEFIAANAHTLRADAAVEEAGKRREWTQAVVAYEAVLQEQPDNVLAVSNAKQVYGWLGRSADIPQMLGRVADNLPRSFDANLSAAAGFLQHNDLVAAEQYLQRSQDLARINGTPANAASAVAVLRAGDLWARQNVHDAAVELDGTEQSVFLPANQNGEWADPKAYVLGNVTLGRLGRAEALARSIANPASQTTALAVVLAARRNWTELRRVLQSATDRTDPLARGGSYLVDAGMLDEARRLVGDIKDAGGVVPSYRYFIEQSITAREHRFADVLRLGDEALAARPSRQQTLRIVVNSADAYMSLHNPQAAVRILERETASPAASVANNFNGGFEWFIARKKLADMYHLVGREHDARTVEDDLVKLLAVSDADDPLLIELKKRVAERR